MHKTLPTHRNEMRENRLIFITPEQARNRLVAGLGNEEENKRIIAEAEAANNAPVVPNYDAWKASGASAAGGYEGFVENEQSAFDLAIAEVEKSEFYYNSAGQKIAANAGNIFTNKTTGAITDKSGNQLFTSPEEAAQNNAAASGFLDTTAPWYAKTATLEVNQKRKADYESGTLKIGGDTPSQSDTEYERNIIINAENAKRAAADPNYTYEALPTNPQEAMAIQNSESNNELSFNASQNQIQAELDVLGLDKVSDTVKRAIAAGRAGFTQGRSGGVYSGANAGTSKAIAKEADRIFTTAKLSIEKAQNQRAYYTEQLKKAVASKNTELQAYFSQQIAAQDSKIAATRAQAEKDSALAEQIASEAVSEAQQQAADRIETLAASPSTAAAMNVADLADLAVQSGFASSVAATLARGIIADAQAVQEATKTKNALDIQTAQVNYAKSIRSLENPMSEKIEGYKMLKTALDNGEITQAYFDKETLGVTPTDPKYGFTEIGGNLYATDPKTGKATFVATDGAGNPVAPFFSQAGNGNITYDYGSRSKNANDNLLLQNGKYGTPGVDIDGNTGDAIQAFVSGTITQVANNSGYGNQVIIADSSGNQHMYSHLRELPNLAVGQKISAGGLVGYIGNTGSVFDIDGNRPPAGDTETGSHLDYRIKGEPVLQPNGQYSPWIDPNKYLGQNVEYEEVEKHFNSVLPRLATLNQRTDFEKRFKNAKNLEDKENILRDAQITAYIPLIDDVVSRFETNVKDFKDVKNKSDQMDVVYQSYIDGGKKSAVAIDQALISLFNKITDPASVVRESEFERTGQSLGLAEKTIGKAVKQLKGGAGLTDDTREEIVRVAKALTIGAEERFKNEKSRAEQTAKGRNIPLDFMYSELGLSSQGDFNFEIEQAEKPVNIYESTFNSLPVDIQADLTLQRYTGTASKFGYE